MYNSPFREHAQGVLWCCELETVGLARKLLRRLRELAGVSGAWAVTPVATTTGAAADLSNVFGDGDYQVLSFPTNGVHPFFRLLAR